MSSPWPDSCLFYRLFHQKWSKVQEIPTIIDRGAELLGLSRTEFRCRPALREAQAAILNETVIPVSPDGFHAFIEAISAPATTRQQRLRKDGPQYPACRVRQNQPESRFHARSDRSR
ncbi:MAG: DUF1778 domain-containing protein [Alphaproteobacteria bacterium]|nr:DUF1778 domain-containing protein [Alphaproteobacteria bacterium]